jgi:hypothetical protein
MRKTLTLPAGPPRRPAPAAAAGRAVTLTPLRRVRAAPAGPERPPRPDRRPAEPPTRWARHPLTTGSGRRLLAVRLTPEGRIEVLAAKTGAPTWVPAETVLSPQRAAEWARRFYFA